MDYDPVQWPAVRASLEKSAAEMIDYSIALKKARRNTSAATARASAMLLAELAKALKEGGA